MQPERQDYLQIISESKLTEKPSILDWLKPSGLFDLSDKPSFRDLEPVISWVASHACELQGHRRSLARVALIEHLSGLGVKGAAGLADAVLGKESTGKEHNQGEAIIFTHLEPWPEPVDGDKLLTKIAGVLTRYVVLQEGIARVIALWVMLTYLIDATDILPILAITSPEKRCGKTLLIEILSELVSRPLSSSNISSAALFRTVEKFRPTLQIDEADTFLEKNEELRGIINSGHTRSGAKVIRSVGDDHEPRTFSTWCPKVLAKIGPFASTIEDRSIVVSMKRKAPGERVERFFHRKMITSLAEICRKCTRWATDNLDAVRDADPQDLEFLHDRANNNWRPLLAIADVAGGQWPSLARHSAELLSGTRNEGEETVRIQLLIDIMKLFEDRKADRLSSHDMAEVLGKMEDRPWSEFGKREKPITPRQIASLLKPFGIKPSTIRIEAETPKGYLSENFKDTFSRYLDLQSATSATSASDTGFSGNMTLNTDLFVADKEPCNPNGVTKVADVADRKVEITPKGVFDGVEEVII